MREAVVCSKAVVQSHGARAHQGDTGVTKKSKVADKTVWPEKNQNFVPGWFGGRLTSPEAQKRATGEMSSWMRSRVVAHAADRDQRKSDAAGEAHRKM